MTHQTAEFDHFVYDSNNQNQAITTPGKKRIGISATEIELLDDVPLEFSKTSKTRSTSTGVKQDQQTRSTLQKEPSRTIYANPEEEGLGSAVDRLLERYAPDALTSNMYNTSTTRRPLNQQDLSPINDEPPRSTFQTTSPVSVPVPTPPSSTDSHNYSTIIRPNRGIAASQPTDYSSQANQSAPPKTRPVTNYDSFQHVYPQSQPPQQPQQQAQQQPQQPNPIPIPLQLKNGSVPPIVPGQLYTLDDDPLDLIYDRQAPSAVPPPRPPSLSKQAKAALPSTFQPTTRPTTFQDPLAAIFPHLSYATTTTTTTTAPAPAPAAPEPTPALPGFDLGNLIKQVQQDYFYEIQPFVSSVKFIDKDHQLGQNLGDVNFSTPVTVRKGFLGKADDILRRSFGRQDHARRVPEKKQEQASEMYSDEDDDQLEDLPTKKRQNPLQNLNSKLSNTSMTSTSTGITEYSDDEDSDDESSEDSRPAHVVDKSTSPPPKEQPVPETKKSPIIDKTTTESTTRPVVPIQARRVLSDELSDSPLASEEDESEDEKTTKKELPKPAAALAAVATNMPIIKPDESAVRRRSEELKLSAQKSDDIHPVPPTIKPDAPTEKPPEFGRRPIVESDSERESGSEDVSDSDEEGPVTNSRNPPPGSASATTATTLTRGAESTAATTNSRFSATTNSRFPAETATTNATPSRTSEPAVASTNSRFPATTTTTTSATPSATTTNSRFPAATNTTTANSRFPAATTTATTTSSTARNEPSVNPNLTFVPPEQRNPTSASSTSNTTAPAATTPRTPKQPQSGSARLFAPTTESKSTHKKSANSDQSSFRDRLKGFKSRFLGKKD